VTVPEKATAIFRFGEKEIPLKTGENQLEF
jgi:hypothetical protein